MDRINYCRPTFLWLLLAGSGSLSGEVHSFVLPDPAIRPNTLLSTATNGRGVQQLEWQRVGGFPCEQQFSCRRRQRQLLTTKANSQSEEGEDAVSFTLTRASIQFLSPFSSVRLCTNIWYDFILQKPKSVGDYFRRAGNKFKARPGTYLLIPCVAAVVGWFTNWLAVQMIFYPIKFRGIPIWIREEIPLGLLGWQGIVVGTKTIEF